MAQVRISSNTNMAAIEPIHPGEHLKEMLDDLRISPRRLAEAMGTPPALVSEIVRGRKSISPETAIKIGAALDMSAEFWLNLQRIHDLDAARASVDASAVERISTAAEWRLG